jgi:hypothetical protein
MQTNYNVRRYEVAVFVCGFLLAVVSSILGTAAATGLVLSLPVVVGLTSISTGLGFVMNRLQSLGSSMGPQVNLTLSPEPVPSNVDTRLVDQT